MLFVMLGLFIAGIVLFVLSGTKFKKRDSKAVLICSIVIGIVCEIGAIILALPH
jgi:hypothetical protein